MVSFKLVYQVFLTEFCPPLYGEVKRFFDITTKTKQKMIYFHDATCVADTSVAVFTRKKGADVYSLPLLYALGMQKIKYQYKLQNIITFS